MTILVTGAAGFIGFSLAARLLQRGEQVYGIDNFSPYYDVALKRARLALLTPQPGFRFAEIDVADRAAMTELFARENFTEIVHFAAQVGVRYSVEHPLLYVDANLVGFGHILEGARAQQVRHLVFASSSSVYGNNRKLPFSEDDNVDHPISLYAASKKANELAAHSYAHLFGLPCTGLRFFTVYGPWGRPDMALFKFANMIVAGEPIPVYNEGRMVRDFTYIDDVVESVLRVMEIPPSRGADDASGTDAPYRIFNVGCTRPVELMHYIRTLEENLGRKATLQLLPIQPGDVTTTLADTSRLERAIGYRPTTQVEEGIARFVDWYVGHYRC
jgi:UDP-glucuronate 4-epimerase